MRVSVAAFLMLLAGALLAQTDSPKPHGWQSAAFGFGAGLSAYFAVRLIVDEARAERKRGRK